MCMKRERERELVVGIEKGRVKASYTLFGIQGGFSSTYTVTWFGLVYIQANAYSQKSSKSGERKRRRNSKHEYTSKGEDVRWREKMYIFF